MVKKIALSIVAFCLFGLGAVFAQGSSASPGIELVLVPQTATTEDKNQYWLEAHFTLPEKLHQTLQEKYFGLVINQSALPAGAVLGKLVYPPSEKKILDILSYEKFVLIKQAISFKQIPPSNFEIEGSVFWQLCYDDGVCLVPQKKDFIFTVQSQAGLLGSAKTNINRLVQDGSGQTSLGSPFALSDAQEAPAIEQQSPNDEERLDFAGVLLILLFAFLGGAILNLMPCVLPVLSIKALSLIKNAGENPKRRWAHAWMSAAGIVSSLLALALILVILQSAGLSIGWGIQFQNPWYMLGLVVLVLGFALSLFDIFILTAPSVKQNKRTGLSGSFFSGFLTVVLATPCTAPFLGTALGLAFSSPWWVIILVFGFIGIGLALPFFLLTVIPGALRFLPKPGKWMETFKGVMAFALIATGIWLLTVLNTQLATDSFSNVLWFLGSFFFLAWIWGLVQRSALGGLKRKLAQFLVLALLVAAGCAFLSLSPRTSATSQDSSAKLPDGWQVFSEQAVDTALVQGKTVFVDFTADWCLTCQINKAGPLADPRVLNALNESNVVRLQGDYTNADPIIAAWLKRYKRAGVPFNAFLRANKATQVLPEILTSDGVLAALTTISL